MMRDLIECKCNSNSIRLAITKHFLSIYIQCMVYVIFFTNIATHPLVMYLINICCFFFFVCVVPGINGSRLNVMDTTDTECSTNGETITIFVNFSYIRDYADCFATQLE